jgi:3-hydroxy-D-aspartate aldolase
VEGQMMTVNKIQQHFELGFDIPAFPGMAEADIQTPCLIIDLDRFEHNLKRMADILAPFPVTLRPHAKMHKSVDVATQQHAIGNASGICCQKVSEAEVFANAGFKDILITNQVCDPLKIARLAGIAKATRKMSVCVDDLNNVVALSAEAERQKTHIHCLVELDCGGGRCGLTSPEKVIELATAIEAADGLIFDGLQAYHGNIQHEQDFKKRKLVMDSMIKNVKACLLSMSEVGLSCRVISGGGTGSFLFEANSGVYTEIQCGSYAFMDADYGKIKNENGHRLDKADWKNALFILTSIMSTSIPGQAVCDAGLKVQSVDSGLPQVFGRDDIRYANCSDEHGLIEDKNNQLVINQKLRLIPGHCDPTCNLHDWYVCVRQGLVEAVWPVSARGKAL